MAKCWRICDKLHYCFVLLYILTPVDCIEDYYLYKLDGIGDADLLDGQDDVHFHQLQRHSINKRESISVNNVKLTETIANETTSATTIKTILPTTATVSVTPAVTSNNVTAPKPAKDKNAISTFKKVPDRPHDDDANNGTTVDLKTFTTTTTNQIDRQPNGTFDISIANFSDSSLDINKTLNEHDIQKIQTDTHLYYNSTFLVNKAIAEHYWMNMSGREDALTNDVLSKSHRRAATVKLSFDFPFYGHLVRNVTIATGGFLYTGEYVHSWLAATQYVAPLMANFDTSLSNNSLIRYVDNGTAFTVQWERVSLQDKPNGGEFTFQVTLHDSGDIVFVYKHVPLLIEEIQDNNHPVKVGLSDAYIINRTIFFIHRKTIYEYHRVQFKKEDIGNWTVIYLNALPTCLDNKDCESCYASETNFQCLWCEHAKRCSNGLDRYRQDWLTKGCDRQKKHDGCGRSVFDHVPTATYHDEDETNYESTMHDANTDLSSIASKVSQVDEQASRSDNASGNNRASISGVSAIFLLMALVASIGFWILYAYRNPHSTSGQILIKYRPSQWRWRRGEARYTAATIHM